MLIAQTEKEKISTLTRCVNLSILETKPLVFLYSTTISLRIINVLTKAAKTAVAELGSE